MKTNRGKGFTLIELLVVITIIAFLAATILPALARSKDNPLKIQCVSGIKQIMLGITLFAADHEDRLPYNTDSTSGLPNGLSLALDVRSSWLQNSTTRPELGYHIAPYLPSAKQTTFVSPGTSGNEVLVCPSFTLNPQYISRAPNPSDVNNSRRMYRLRAYVEGIALWNYTSPKLSSIQQPATNGAIADLDRSFPGGSSGTLSASWSQLPDMPVHGTTRNYGFFDGHVDTLSTTGHTATITTGILPYGWITSSK